MKPVGPKERILQALAIGPDPYVATVDLAELPEEKMTWHQKQRAAFRSKKEAQEEQFPTDEGGNELTNDLLIGNERV